MTTRLAYSLLAVAVAATPAAANTIAADAYSVPAPTPAPAPTTTVATYEPAAPPPHLWLRTEGRIGMMLGGSDVGDADGFSAGFAASADLRVNDVTLRAQLDYFGVGDGGDEAMNRHGRSTRIGGALRYSLLASAQVNKQEPHVAVDFWGEAGLGWEHVAWKHGGVLDRPSLELAIGFDLDGRGRMDGRRRRHIGYFMDFRTLVGEGPPSDMPATCAGPCTRATQPSRTDISMFYELGFHWGH